MIALDSNLFIYLLEDNRKFGEPSRSLFKAIERTYLDGCASELVFHEVLAYGKLTESDAQELRRMLEKQGILFSRVSRGVLLEAATLRRRYGLGAFDSIHVASALAADASHFVTNDLVLLKKKVPGIKLLPLRKAAALFPRDINRLAP